MTKRIIVTGGAGFIGSALVRMLVGKTDHHVLVLDKMTYAGSFAALAPAAAHPRYSFVKADIADRPAVHDIVEDFQPDLIMNLAAETHVDRSIDAPLLFVETNVVGAASLLHAATNHWSRLPEERKTAFRFHHISTDEVFGSLGDQGHFSEATAYDPRSPYSASKAASDHMVRAWSHTYRLPTIITNCSNNYGPYQFPEKLIPRTIINALLGKPLEVYGDGSNVRDWLHVDDHARALLLAAESGRPGETYCVGGDSERRNIDVVRAICRIVDALSPDARIGPREGLIAFVADRPGHDFRYAIDAAKIRRELGWRPDHDFESGIEQTVRWYLENRSWWERLQDAAYQPAHLAVA